MGAEIKTTRGRKPLGISEDGLSRHVLLIFIFVIIYLATLSTFFVAYVLTKFLGTILAASIAFIASFVTLAMGARAFWHFIKELSKVEKRMQILRSGFREKTSKEVNSR